MGNKRFFLTFYLISIILLVIAPLNVFKKINFIYLFNIRLDYIFHGILFYPWIFVRYKKNQVQWLIFGLILAFLVEGIQLYIPYRKFSAYDLIANLVGIIFGYLVYNFLIFLKRFSNTNTNFL